MTFASNPQEGPDEPSDGDNLDAGGSTGQVIEDPSQDSLANVSSPHGSGNGNAAPQEPPTEHLLRAGSTGEGDTGAIVETVTRLLEAQRHMMEVQVQALASQSVPPLRKFTGENVNTDDGSIDLWIEQFEERADVTGWNKEQKLFQLKAHLAKTARHAVRMLPEEEKDSYKKLLVALQKRFRSLDIEELRGLEFHQLMQEGRSVEELGVELQKVGRKAFPASNPKEFDRIIKGRFYQALLPKWQRKLGAPSPLENFDELFMRARMVERHDQQYNTGRTQQGSTERLDQQYNTGRTQQSSTGRHQPNTARRNQQGDTKPDEARSTPHGFRKKPNASHSESNIPREEFVSRQASGRPYTRNTSKKGCFNCGEPSHFHRDCQRLQPESRGRSSGVSALSGELKGSDPPPKDLSIPEQSIQQLEQVLASMKLNMEQTKLKKSNVGMVISPSAGTVGPVLYLNIKMEGHPVKAVVDSGAQCTIISRDLLHQVAANMKKNGRTDPDLVLPSAKLCG